jgi:hypothetical protein
LFRAASGGLSERGLAVVFSAEIVAVAESAAVGGQVQGLITVIQVLQFVDEALSRGSSPSIFLAVPSFLFASPKKTGKQEFGGDEYF